MTNREIAAPLHLSRRTVENHRHRAFTELSGRPRRRSRSFVLVDLTVRRIAAVDMSGGLLNRA
jgi:DNA-binding NarL/FixJ family response regulator